MNIFKTISLEKTPDLFRWAMAIRGFMLILPVMTLFYQHKGLSLGDFFLIQGIVGFCAFLLEIPSGYLGDLFCRKKVIIISSISYFIGNVIWLFGSGFWAIFIGEIFFTMFFVMYSGTGEAYLYDVLKKLGREKDMNKEYGKVIAYSTYGTALATLLGALIYRYIGPEETVLIESIFMLVGIVMLFFLPKLQDVKRVVKDGKNKFMDILDIAKYAVTHKNIKWLVFFPAVFGAGTLILMWGQQPLMQENMVPVALFGVFVCINQLFRAVLSHFCHSMFEFMKTKVYTISAFLVLLVGFAAASVLSGGFSNMYIISAMLLLVAFAAASQAALSVVMNSMINHQIKSDERATVLSVSAMFSRLTYGILTIILKLVIDGYNMQTGFVVITPIVLLLTLVPMLRLLKTEKSCK